MKSMPSHLCSAALAVVSLAFGEPVSAQSAETPPNAESLTEGIESFVCSDQSNIDSPVILIEDDRGWRMVGYDAVDQIQRIENGFQLRLSDQDNFLGFLKESEEGWVLETFNENGLSTAKCRSMHEFMETLTYEIAPKLNSNANELTDLLSEAEQNLRERSDEVESLRDTNQVLERRVVQLTKRNTNLQSKYDRVTDFIRDGGVVEAASFIDSVLKTKELTKRIELVEESGLSDTWGWVKHCVNRLRSEPSRFGDKCRGILLGYMARTLPED